MINAEPEYRHSGFEVKSSLVIIHAGAAFLGAWLIAEIVDEGDET